MLGGDPRTDHDRPRRLLSWLDEPATTRGIRFAGDHDEWHFWPYRRLAELTGAVAAGLVGAGVPAGGVVATVQRSSPQLVATLFGAMVAGCVPSPIAPPTRLQSWPAYGEHMVSTLRTARPRVVVADPDLVPSLVPLVEAAGLSGTVAVVDVETVLAAGTGDGRRGQAAHALLQFTSGSAGVARGVRLPFAAVEANVDAIRRWLAMTESDATASWLPVHHDMGLIGCLLAPVVNRGDIWMMRPEQFVHRPLRYLECFGRHGARLTAMPTFGLAHVVRRVRPSQVEGMDLRDWRAVIVGAERLAPVVLDAFHRLLAPCGFSRSAILPAYGLAECTLAVTGVPLARGWSAVPVEPRSVAVGRRIRPPTAGLGRLDVVACGPPLRGVHVAIQDELGTEVPDGVVGEIVVGGASVPDGQPGSGVRSGDAGFLVDGELYVLGRLGDSMKVRGRTLFAEDLEAALGAAGVPARRVATLLGDRNGEPTVVAVFERARPEWLAAAARLLARDTGEAKVVLVDAPRGTIVRTGNGKVQRRRIWRDFLDGRLRGHVVDPAKSRQDPSIVSGMSQGSISVECRYTQP